MRLLQRIANTFYLYYRRDALLLLCFLSNQENLNMIDHVQYLFCDTSNTTVKLNRKQDHPLSVMFLTQLDT